VKEQQEFSPNYIELGEMKISRANIIGVVVSENPAMVDDGSGKIPLRSFEKPVAVHVGDIVMIVGRPREFNSERYLLPETVQKVDERWLKIRKIELKDFVVPDIKEETAAEETAEGSSQQDKVLQFIRQNDTGQGVEYDSVVKSGIEESIIEIMLKEGELFENMPGKLKVLE